MRALKGELLLEAWERGATEADPGRAATMLALACGDRTRDELEGLSIAECDVELLRLRWITFGDALRGCVPCGACGTRVEFGIAVSSLVERLEALRPRGEAKWQAGRMTFSMRAVTSRDVAAIRRLANPRQALLARCVSVEGEAVGEALASCEDIAVENFNRINEGAETRIAVGCPACGTIEHADLDIARFLWTEVRHAALALLREVHELASAYGWSEGAILAMTNARRARYLEMARA
jgi:hypothetical protein